jgi:hypothetical protein
VSLPEITDDDRAVQAEAIRLYTLPGTEPRIGIASIAAALVRTGWKPVDPDLILAREVCAEKWPASAEFYRNGNMDNYVTVQAALAAIKAADARRRGNG